MKNLFMHKPLGSGKSKFTFETNKDMLAADQDRRAETSKSAKFVSALQFYVLNFISFSLLFLYFFSLKKKRQLKMKLQK